MKTMTLTQMKKANKAIGHDYFSKATMQFWNSRIEVQPNQYNLFIESVQPEEDENSTLYVPRRYLIKYFNSENSKVVSITSFTTPNEYISTLEQAKQLKSIITKAFADLANREKFVMDNLSEVEFTNDWMIFKAYVTEGKEYECKAFNVSYFGTICG